MIKRNVNTKRHIHYGNWIIMLPIRGTSTSGALIVPLSKYLIFNYCVLRCKKEDDTHHGEWSEANTG